MKNIVFAIDPGTTYSAWLRLVGASPVAFGMVPNEDLLDMLHRAPRAANVTVAIEKVESYGMAQPCRVVQVPRREVKLAICHSPNANDSNIRAALIDLYGGSAAIGLKKAPGPLYGITKDVWSALAIAVTTATTAQRKTT